MKNVPSTFPLITVHGGVSGFGSGARCVPVSAGGEQLREKSIRRHVIVRFDGFVKWMGFLRAMLQGINQITVIR
jgi:hypothetical protein